MKLKKTFFGLLTAFVIIVTLLGLATAISPNETSAYYNWDTGSGSTLVDQSGNGNNGTINADTSTFWSSLYPEYSLNGDGSPYSGSFDGTDDYVSIPDDNTLDITGEISISAWINPDDIYSGSSWAGTIISKYDYRSSSPPSSISYGVWMNEGGKIKFTTSSDGTVDNREVSITTNSYITTGNWQLVTVTYDGSNAYIYIDGTLEETLSHTTSIYSGDTPVTIGNYLQDGSPTSVGWFDGNIDDVSIWDRALSASEVSDIYDGGFSTGSDNFSVSVTDQWSGSDINNITVTIDNNTYTNNTGNTVTTDILQNSTSLHNITVEAPDYFSKSYNDYNVSSNLNAQLFQSEIDFSSFDLVSGDELSGVNYTIDGIQQDVFHLSTGNYTVLVEPSGYYAKNHTFNVSALDNRTESISGLYDSRVDVTLNDVITESLVETSSYVEISSQDHSYTNLVTSANGSLSFNISQGNYSLTAWADDYAFHEANITINQSTQSFSYDLYANNSVWVTAVDFDTGSELDNFTVELYNAENVYEVTDESGTARLSNVTSGLYTLQVSKEGYANAEYPLTMTGGGHQNVVAYMSTTTASTVFEVVDKISGGSLEGASMSMYKTINGSWTLVSSQTSDLTGRVRFFYTPAVEYKFIVDRDGYDQRTFFLEPLFETYTVPLSPASSVDPDINTGDWVYSINNSGQFYNNMNNSFEISISSGLGSIEYYNLSVFAPESAGGGVETVSCSVAIGCSHHFNLEIVDGLFNETVLVEYSIKESGRSIKTFTKNYVVQGVYNQNTLFSWKDEDFGDGEKAVASTLILLVIVGVVASGSMMLGAPTITISGVALGVMIEILGFVGFVPSALAHVVALGCLLILIFGRGEI